MKKRKQPTKDNKPVTLKQLNQALKPILGKFKGIDNKFEAIDGRFKQIDKRFEVVEKRLDLIEKRLDLIEKRLDLVEYRLENLEKRFLKFEKMFEDNFTKMYNHIDAFMKRTESNEHEILFLGRQHDDLAKYCTEKIAYPIYGRN